MGCFATYFKIFIVCVGCMGLFACSESTVFITSKYKPNREDRRYAIDSFKIVRVIDNRSVPDSVIGVANENKAPLTIDRPLEKYIQSMLNAMICRDTSKPYAIPVMVTIDEFYSDRSNPVLKNCVNNKYSYLFQFHASSGINPLRIQDSVCNCKGQTIPLGVWDILEFKSGDDAPTLQEQSSLIFSGIRETARLFTRSAKDKSILTSQSDRIVDSTLQSRKIDSIDLLSTRIFDYRSGFVTNFYYGKKINPGVGVAYLQMKHAAKKRVESGWSFGAYVYNVSYDNVEGSGIGFFSQFIYKYNLTNDIHGLSLTGTVMPLATLESGAGFNSYCFGGQIQETIGMNIFGNVSLNIGFYQQALVFSKVLPSDVGIAVSISLTGDYDSP